MTRLLRGLSCLKRQVPVHGVCCVLIATSLARPGVAVAQSTEEPELVRPLLVLIEYDPWLWLIASDSPSFALYEDGTVIYRRGERGDYRYFQVTLSRAETSALLTEQTPYADLAALEPEYSVSKWSDQPTNVLVFVVDSSYYAAVSVYGALRQLDDSSRALVPGVFLRVYDYVTTFERGDAAPWKPERIELVVSPYEDGPSEEPVAWPDDWPTFGSEWVDDRGELVSLFLPADHEQRLEAVLDQLAPGKHLQIGGRSFYMQGLRYPFPMEFIWHGR